MKKFYPLADEMETEPLEEVKKLKMGEEADGANGSELKKSHRRFPSSGSWAGRRSTMKEESQNQ